MILRKTLSKTLPCALLLAIAVPATARFLSPDPAPADEENFNRYWYANNNPYTFVDPDGRQALDLSAKFIDLNQRHGSDLDSMRAEMSAGHMQGAAIAAGALALAPAAGYVGSTIAAVVADTAAGSFIGAVAVNGPQIVASAEIVAGTAAAIATGGGAPTPVSMTAAQASNVNRFASKLPAGNSGVSVDALGDGIVATASVPGRVPGSSAVYQKTIDASGQTSSYLKTTFDPRGNVVHIKDKIGGGNIDP